MIDVKITHKDHGKKGTLVVSVQYPEQAKIITQSRAVDFNALIGNIGGYIGLFLGMILDFFKIILGINHVNTILILFNDNNLSF